MGGVLKKSEQFMKETACHLIQRQNSFYRYFGLQITPLRELFFYFDGIIHSTSVNSPKNQIEYDISAYNDFIGD